MYENSFPELRYKNTKEFILRFVSASESILDLGVENPFTDVLKKEGFQILNTGKSDLDLEPDIVKGYDVEVVTALEILEHLVSPFVLLRDLPASKLGIATTMNLRTGNLTGCSKKADGKSFIGKNGNHLLKKWDSGRY